MLATAGTPEKCRRCEDLGADRAVDYKTEDFVKAVHDATGGAGVDVILEMVGGDYLERGVRAMAPGGRLAIIALRKGAKVELDFSAVQAKDAVITGSRLMPRSPVEKARLVAAVRQGGLAANRGGTHQAGDRSHLCTARSVASARVHGFWGARR